MVWRLDDPQGQEADKIKYEIVQFTRGKGIDLGCGPHKIFPHMIGVDSCKDTELFGIEMKPDVVCEDAANLDFIEDGDLDFVFSSHLLEHIKDYRGALANWWGKIKTGGHLVLYLPHRDLYPRIGTPGSNPDHVHDFDEVAIRDAMNDIGGWELLVEEVRDQAMEYSFLCVYRKRGDGLQLVTLPVRPPKSACVVRYGGYGDSIQAANILPELKRQGYHVTFMTTPRGHSILKEDPHIDDWLIQDNDQVPNHELSRYWKVQASRFDKFIQLSESVEGTLLAMPGRANHGWPVNLRREVMGRNYLEWTSALAEIPYRSEARFYPTEAETAKAKASLSPGQFHVLWCLSGSSAHKFYPHMDDVIANMIAAMPRVQIILGGDIACKLLERGWDTHKRVRYTSGEMEVRDTLALAQQVQCVVGPETGVLNAVAFEPMRKVVMLSHSSRENLTKHWVNTATIEPQNTACFPCHRLHYGMEFCHEDKASGAAMCQVNIKPRAVFDAVASAYSAWAANLETTP